MATITLLTDFGLDNWFAGVMKGVIRNINPAAEVIDISHSVKNFSVHAGAFVLKNSFQFFPKETVHVVVVDPGVGSARHAIMVETERYFFIAPDNGVLSYALDSENVRRFICLDNDKFFIRPVSSTFHGRDIFAPVAAHLSAGVDPAEFGSEIDQITRLPKSEPRPLTTKELLGCVIYVDNFGNLITNISRSNLEEAPAKFKTGFIRISIRDKEIRKISSSYAEGVEGELIAVIGSSDYLEIAINKGNAAEELNIREGDEFILKAV